MTSWFFIKNEVAIDLLKEILYVFQVLNMRSLSKINLSEKLYHYSDSGFGIGDRSFQYR
ncbi:MAG: hypothetical protein RMY64_32140 [Nostoc sp. DedQUE08]|uniref:hypothetical protein n=1 Tax=unclassified Nostoc TaxID=2593658 RepID=UPI002AD44E43|nr:MULTISPECIES: hypothetical protein [unclassified Nostoc]MDZ8070206.1 hypothetical protein [Nostoc sp. DedQUE08]MDZ8090658.1 hypothetical protein [Nostoc sp. DedQUE05]MDZ8133305.1 hypothetical protein [Nostoc sp. DedQUE07]